MFFGTHFGSEQSDIIGQLAGGFALAFTKFSFNPVSPFQFTKSRESGLNKINFKILMMYEPSSL